METSGRPGERAGGLSRRAAARLLDRWRAGDDAAGERLILAHLPLVRAAAARFALPEAERDDLVQAGLLGLVRAMRRYDAGGGADLGTFAFPFILGEMREHVRVTAGSGLSRRQWRLLGRARREEGALRQELGREPAAGEVARSLGLEPADLVALLDAASPRLPLAEAVGVTAPDTRGLEERADLLRALSWLSPRLRALVGLRYLEGRRQAEVAAVLGLSQSQVSRLEARALAVLRRLLDEPA